MQIHTIIIVQQSWQKHDFVTPLSVPQTNRWHLSQVAFDTFEQRWHLPSWYIWFCSRRAAEGRKSNCSAAWQSTYEVCDWNNVGFLYMVTPFAGTGLEETLFAFCVATLLQVNEGIVWGYVENIVEEMSKSQWTILRMQENSARFSSIWSIYLLFLDVGRDHWRLQFRGREMNSKG